MTSFNNTSSKGTLCTGQTTERFKESYKKIPNNEFKTFYILDIFVELQTFNTAR